MERCCCHQSILYIRNTKVCKIYIFACLLKWQFSEILVQKNSSSSLSPWNKKSASHTVIIRTLQLSTTCVVKIAELHAHIAKTINFVSHPSKKFWHSCGHRMCPPVCPHHRKQLCSPYNWCGTLPHDFVLLFCGQLTVVKQGCLLTWVAHDHNVGSGVYPLRLRGFLCSLLTIKLLVFNRSQA